MHRAFCQKNGDASSRSIGTSEECREVLGWLERQLERHDVAVQAAPKPGVLAFRHRGAYGAIGSWGGAPFFSRRCANRGSGDAFLQQHLPAPVDTCVSRHERETTRRRASSPVCSFCHQRVGRILRLVAV